MTMYWKLTILRRSVEDNRHLIDMRSFLRQYHASDGSFVIVYLDMFFPVAAL